MKPRLIDFLPLIAIAGIYFLVKPKPEPQTPEPRKPQFPREPADTADTAEPIEPPIPETGPTFNPYQFDGGAFEGAEFTPETLSRVNSTSPTIANLGNKMFAVLNATDSFDDLFDQVFQDEKSDALIDVHFNRYIGKHSGPLMLHSSEGKKLAAALQREFIEIYQENGWQYGRENDIRHNNRFALPKLGNSRGKPVVVSEFGYIDDPVNPIGEWIQTVKGQERIARAYINALKSLDLDRVAISLGHHGDRGSRGARYKQYTETDFAEGVINAILRLQGESLETGEVADGYHHEEKAPKQSGVRLPDLRKPSSNYPTYYGPEGQNWEEIEPETRLAPEPEIKKPRVKFRIFNKRK